MDIKKQETGYSVTSNRFLVSCPFTIPPSANNHSTPPPSGPFLFLTKVVTGTDRRRSCRPEDRLLDGDEEVGSCLRLHVHNQDHWCPTSGSCIRPRLLGTNLAVVSLISLFLKRQ